MKNKTVILAITLILIFGISKYIITSETPNDSTKRLQNKSIMKNITINQNNLTNQSSDLKETIKIKDDLNFPTTKKIGKEDTIYVFYNSGYNGQADIHRGLLIYLLNSSNHFEGKTYFKIIQVVVKFKNNNNETIYKKYTQNSGESIRIKVPKNLTPVTTTIYYKTI